MLCKQRLRINIDRCNSPESCILKVLKACFVNQTWNTIYDIMNECTDTRVLSLNAIISKIE